MFAVRVALGLGLGASLQKSPYLHVDRLGFDSAFAQILVLLQSGVHGPLDVSLQFTTKVTEHRRTT